MTADKFVQDFAAGYKCPSCDSDTGLRCDASGVYRLTVANDDGCPVLAQHRRGGAT